MKIFSFSVIFFGAFVFANCEDSHHVEGRNLEDDLEIATAPIPPAEISDVLNVNHSLNPVQNISEPLTNTTKEAAVNDTAIENVVKYNISSLLRDQPNNDREKPVSNVTLIANPERQKADVKLPSNDLNSSSIDTEVPNLLEVQIQVNLHQQPIENHGPVDISDKIDDDTELIEDGQNTEDELRKHDDQFSEELLPQQRYFAAVVACTLVVMAVLCYIGLWSWRRYLERRYGSRTMLVNAEEFDDPNDIHHFSI